MQRTETILGIIQERGKQRLPVERLYRQLYNRELYLIAYQKLYQNQGSMTPGTTDETIDGMSLAKIDNIIAQLRAERYRWTPARRIYIPKKSEGKRRPLSIPCWSDKLLQEVMRMLLQAYYEPQFSSSSHGFRPNRGCHTALAEIKHWTGTHWFIEGDISRCFDTLDHQVLLTILSEHIHDQRFLKLIEHLLQAGYLEEWKYHKTLSGSPQGGVISPLFSNIYLNKFDQFVENQLSPKYNQGIDRRTNPACNKLYTQINFKRRHNQFEGIKQLRKQIRQIPSTDVYDPCYRRLRYVRYADDWLFGFIGPKSEAEEIKAQLVIFLQEKLKLKLSTEKTLITHARTQAARFLSYDVVVQYNDTKRRHNRRCVNGIIGLRIPKAIIQAKCATYMKRSQPVHLPQRMENSDYAILIEYQAEYNGVVQYYKMANNLYHLHRLYYVMQASLAKTLAGKHKSTATKISKKYGTMIATPFGSLKAMQVIVQRGENKKPLIAKFGGIPLRRETKTTINDQPTQVYSKHSDLLNRLLADACELCGDTKNCEVHHIHKLNDVNKPGRKPKSAWAVKMSALRRKTLVVCRRCHLDIHHGDKTKQRSME